MNAKYKGYIGLAEIHLDFAEGKAAGSREDQIEAISRALISIAQATIARELREAGEKAPDRTPPLPDPDVPDLLSDAERLALAGVPSYTAPEGERLVDAGDGVDLAGDGVDLAGDGAGGE